MFQPKDLALVLAVLIIIVVYFRYPKRVYSTEFRRLTRYVLFFLAYIVLTIIFDFLLNGIDLWSVLRTSRHWLMLLMLIPLIRIPYSQLEKVLRTLFFITIAVSAIIVFEYLSGHYYFTREAYESYSGVSLVTRGSLPSTYALLYVLLLSMGYGSRNKIVRYGLIALLSFSLLLSATKSIALGLFLGFVILVSLKSKSVGGAIGRILLVTTLTLGVVSILPDLRQRLIIGQQSLGKVDDGSMTFRWLLTQERFHYIAQKPETLVFGIGNVTEDHFKGTFQIGHIDSEGEMAMLDTGDIAWALALLRLGLLGTVLWVGLSLVFVWCFHKRKEEFYSIPLISFLLLNLLVLSLAGTTSYMGTYWIVPLISLSIVHQTEEEVLPL